MEVWLEQLERLLCKCETLDSNLSPMNKNGGWGEDGAGNYALNSFPT
jgi:hypothetical protein